MDKKPLDLYRLKKAVESRGGFEKVCKTKKWAEIGRDLGYSGKIMSSLSTSLKNSYDRWLNPYEHYLRQAKPSVYQQLEYEYGGPLTPSPAPSPIKRSSVNTPSSLRGESPTRHATDALQASLSVSKGEGDRDASATTDPPPIAPQPTTSGFTAINSSAFTPVNASFTSVNRPTPPDAQNLTPLPKRHDSPASLPRELLDIRPSGLGPANALKRQLSFDSLDSIRKEASADKDDSESGSRRSKRLKKGTFHCENFNSVAAICTMLRHRSSILFMISCQQSFVSHGMCLYFLSVVFYASRCDNQLFYDGADPLLVVDVSSGHQQLMRDTRGPGWPNLVVA